MTALGIDMTTSDTTYDYTGLVSGHQRPAVVEQAHQDMIAAWSAYMEDTDLFEVGYLDHGDVARSLANAQEADRTWQEMYQTWQTSLGDCTCMPGRPDEDERKCAPCRAKAKLDYGELPY